jgi:cytochrome oxidase Cu insertion factor (SCO1/SenC/PrrC family)
MEADAVLGSFQESLQSNPRVQLELRELIQLVQDALACFEVQGRAQQRQAQLLRRYALDEVKYPQLSLELTCSENALRGRVQVVVMFFANCQYACPLLVHDMKEIESALPEAVRTKTGFLLVSFDSEHDTPSVLHAYRARQNLGTNSWTLLRGRPDDILELAVLLGVKYKQDARGQFAHSNMITVLDPNGEIVHQQFGLGQDVKPALKAIERAAAK